MQSRFDLYDKIYVAKNRFIKRRPTLDTKNKEAQKFKLSIGIFLRMNESFLVFTTVAAISDKVDILSK